MSWLTQANACPGLFYGTRAQDGFLLRIRIPAGILHLSQLKVIADLLVDLNCDRLQITNRANLQIRGIQRALDDAEFSRLQAVGLAAVNPHTDHLRNLMGSPTAGIDPEEILDTRPYIQQIDQFLQQHPEYQRLSAKFSFGLDGGGCVGIGSRSPVSWEHRLNDIQLTAVQLDDQQTRFLLQVAGEKKLINTQYAISPEALFPTISALTEIYHHYTQQVLSTDSSAKVRLRSLIEDWGIERLLQAVQEQSQQSLHLTEKPLPASQPYRQFGIQPQKESDLFYLGVSPFLGQITHAQLKTLISVLTDWSCQELRLTPWQGLIIPHLTAHQALEAEAQFQAIGFKTIPSQPVIVACAGQPVCKSAAAPTHALAKQLLQSIDQTVSLTEAVSIHISACSKFCAQSSPAQITILAADSSGEQMTSERYNIFFGDNHRFDRILGPILDFQQVISFITEVLQRYQLQRDSTSESLIQFLLRSQSSLPFDLYCPALV
ncbi:precorrin-3B synthase [Synechococcus elongatus IITB7]|uniref:precorrin-3B synthase n=1 Tax=Synechococcus elongatus TaxID=32046 RepID=UPI0030CD99EA